MKYLHLGLDTSIEIKNIVGIFDLDTTSTSKHTREFLSLCEKEKRVVNVSYELPKSYILYDFEDALTIETRDNVPVTYVAELLYGKLMELTPNKYIKILINNIETYM